MLHPHCSCNRSPPLPPPPTSSTCRVSATPPVARRQQQQVNVTIAAVASMAQPLGLTCTNYTVLNIKYSNNIYETLTRASLMGATPPCGCWLCGPGVDFKARHSAVSPNGPESQLTSRSAVQLVQFQQRIAISANLVAIKSEIFARANAIIKTSFLRHSLENK